MGNVVGLYGVLVCVRDLVRGDLPEAVKPKIDSLEEFVVANVRVAPLLPERPVLLKVLQRASGPDTDITGSNPQRNPLLVQADRPLDCGVTRLSLTEN